MIYFIHHVSAALQVANLIAAVGKDLAGAIDQLFPERVGVGRSDEAQGPEGLPEGFKEQARPVHAPAGGYLQAIDVSELMETAV